MTLANRLIGDWSRVYLLIAERNDFPGPAWTFENFRDEMGDLLFQKCGPARGIVVLSPSRVEAGTGYELLVLASNAGEARTSIENVARTFRTHARV